MVRAGTAGLLAAPQAPAIDDTHVANTDRQAQEACRVCGDVGPHSTYWIREMMFGTREQFEYFRCVACGCLQIRRIPGDLARHYPGHYYAQAAASKQSPDDRPTPLQRWINRQTVRPIIFGKGFRFARLMRRGRPLPKSFFRSRPEMLCRAKLSGSNARILDVGCGESAVWLNDLRDVGFAALWGVDPFLKADIRRGGLQLIKDELHSFATRAGNSFELVAFNHSLEHVPDQRQALAAASELLVPNGTCLVRIPMLPCAAWDTYGVDWVELDAPRHLYIHSRKSIELLAVSVGLKLRNVSFDTAAFEIYGSEQYRRDIPLTDPRSHWVNEYAGTFSSDQLADFVFKAEASNANGTAGRAVLEFSKTGGVRTHQ
jgi:SAM-dependent methyltransferase